MKASEFITHLQQMIEEHGDLPLALMEYCDITGEVNYICADIDSVRTLYGKERLFDLNDEVTTERKVFLID